MVYNIPAISGRSLVKFEGGYTVETLFDGSKHGIEPYSVELSPTGDLLVLDCENSNLYKISTPLSQCMLIFHLEYLLLRFIILVYFVFLHAILQKCLSDMCKSTVQ